MMHATGADFTQNIHVKQFDSQCILGVSSTFKPKLWMVWPEVARYFLLMRWKCVYQLFLQVEKSMARQKMANYGDSFPHFVAFNYSNEKGKLSIRGTIRFRV